MEKFKFSLIIVIVALFTVPLYAQNSYVFKTNVENASRVSFVSAVFHYDHYYALLNAEYGNSISISLYKIDQSGSPVDSIDDLQVEFGNITDVFIHNDNIVLFGESYNSVTRSYQTSLFVLDDNMSLLYSRSWSYPVVGYIPKIRSIKQTAGGDLIAMGRLIADDLSDYGMFVVKYSSSLEESILLINNDVLTVAFDFDLIEDNELYIHGWPNSMLWDIESDVTEIRNPQPQEILPAANRGNVILLENEELVFTGEGGQLLIGSDNIPVNISGPIMYRRDIDFQLIDQHRIFEEIDNELQEHLAEKKSIATLEGENGIILFTMDNYYPTSPVFDINEVNYEKNIIIRGYDQELNLEWTHKYNDSLFNVAIGGLSQGGQVCVYGYNYDFNQNVVQAQMLLFDQSFISSTQELNQFLDNKAYAFPNPVREYLNIRLPLEEVGGLSCFNSVGLKQTINYSFQSDSTIKIDVVNLKEGIYFIEVVDHYGNNTVIRFLKN